MRRIEPWARDLLARSTIDGHTLCLPEQLARADYLAIDKVIRALGGKWDRKARCHVFPFDPRTLIDGASETGTYTDRRQDLQLFETPQPLAQRMAASAVLFRGARVLEPSAGRGRIVRELVALGAHVTAVEIDPHNAESVRACDDAANLTVHCADFIEWCASGAGQFDAIVMNPPFAKGQDVRHMLAAWALLKPGGRFVSIASAGTAFRRDALYGDFRTWLAENDVARAALPSGTFSDSGTSVATCLLTATKPARPALILGSVA